MQTRCRGQAKGVQTDRNAFQGKEADGSKVQAKASLTRVSGREDQQLTEKIQESEMGQADNVLPNTDLDSVPKSVSRDAASVGKPLSS